MKASLSLFVLVCLIATSPATAQLDPGPDGLGIYADPAGMVNSLIAEPGIVEVQLLATNITAPEVKVWSVHVSFRGNVVITDIKSDYPMDYGSGGPDARTMEYVVTAYPDLPYYETELLAEPILYLATLEIWLTDTEPVDVHLGIISTILNDDPPSHAYYAVPGDATSTVITEFNPSSGDWNLPVMRINGEAPVPVEVRAWGDIKAVFR